MMIRYRLAERWWSILFSIRRSVRGAFGRLVLAALLDRTIATEPTAVPLADLGGGAVVVDAWRENGESVVALAVDGSVVRLSGGRALMLASELARRVGEADRER